MFDLLSCDTSVILPPLTADGSVIFAKNSDRAINESQPLVHYPRATYVPDSTLCVQYLEIPQVETTWEVIGSAPYWLWGFEMGVNEWGVTIGNEAVQTRELSHDKALIGMDLVRLGLERAQTADEAVYVIGALLEEYGQGGPCEATSNRTYQNSFIIADASGAWILETAGHRWVAKQVRDRAAISNLLTINQTWDAGSLNVREHAIEQGWWTASSTWASAYQDPETDLSTRTCRLDRARNVLGDLNTGAGIREMMGLLRDHNGADLPTGPDPIPTICMHANPAFPVETAASMVVHIRPDRPQLLATTIWTSFGSPCLSVFRPIYPFAVGTPGTFAIGSSEFNQASPWWVFERLQRQIARSPENAGPIRIAFAQLQNAFIDEASEVEAQAAGMLAENDEAGAVAVLRQLVESTSARALDLADRLFREFTPISPIPEIAAFWDVLDTAVQLNSD